MLSEIIDLKINARRIVFFRVLIKTVIGSVFILFGLMSNATERDTVLNAVYSHPFFYNVLADAKGNIYAGTSEGIFQLDGTKLILHSKQEGYITLSQLGDPVISKDGIRNYYERKYLHLLPFPDQGRDEYHAGSADYFYICSGGRIYIYDIVPYSYSYPNHSIRTISENFVGTYSGIYFRGKILPFPPFTDGYIREIDGLAFVCYNDLLTIDTTIIQSANEDSLIKGIKQIKHTGVLRFRDACFTKSKGSYYLSSTTDLLRLEKGGIPLSIYKTRKKISEIVILGEYKTNLYFGDGEYILKLSNSADKVDTLTHLPAEVLDGSVIDRNMFLLTGEGLYQLNSDNELEKLTSLSQAHTLEVISPTDLILSTNNGLFRFNAVNKVLTPLIRGVEFNRKALFKKGDLLQVGSINGLYTIDVKDLELLASKNRSVAEETKVPASLLIISLVALLAVGTLAYLLIRARKKLALTEVQLTELNVEVLDRDKIEQYIRENLATASLKSITDHFNTNISHIYKLIEPEKPGTIIQKMRIEKLTELKRAGKDINQIAEATGLSVSYLRKIKNKIDES